MIAGMPALTHKQQQDAVERIQELMSEGMSSGQAIALVAAEIRQNHQGDTVAMMFDEEDDEFNDNNDSDEEHHFDDGEEEDEQ
ncbi:YoaH family protein [Pectobacterium polaris]|uniref:YoaH family protein n=1 Tax=Pectobacterium polaris TaxID=2042057 RepID=UPI000D606CB6|nr:YoaH family protein [Pectobacterium polaris]MCU1787888.1 YoaH family protein [Pectobacterium polaris]PWD61757.1 YoaH family protein [Pectobacterium polaris]